MNAPDDALIGEALATGTLQGLPRGHFIGGRFVKSLSGNEMESFDPGRGRAFASFAAGDAAGAGSGTNSGSGSSTSSRSAASVNTGSGMDSGAGVAGSGAAGR